MVAGAGYAVKLSSEYDKAFNTLITKTQALESEYDSLDEAMTNVYANNFGESMEDVAEAMATVRNATWLAGEELQKATEDALLFRDVFGFEVEESTRSATMLMQQFGMTSHEAYNLMSQGAQLGLNKNGDLLDVINEYSVHFNQLGFEAEDMFNILVAGADSGAFSVDKVGDAMKEFGIRAKDNSDTTKEAFKALGLDADKMSQAFAKGGDDASGAFIKVNEALASVKDPLKQNEIAVALYGTMWEDLGSTAVLALSDIGDNFNRAYDSMDEINNIKYDDIGSALEGLKRTLEVDVIEPVGEDLKPVVEDVIDFVKSNAPQIKDVITDVAEKVGDFISFVVDNKDAILSTIAGIGAGMLVWNVASTIKSVVDAIKAYKTANELATTSQAIFNAVLNANPIMLIATIIATIIVALVTFIATNDEARAKIVEIWNKIKEVFGNVIDSIVNFFTVTIPEAFTTFKNKVSEIFTSVVNFIKENWQGLLLLLVNPIAGAFKLIYDNCDGFRAFVDNFVQKIKDFFVNTWSSISAFFTETIPALISNIVAWFQDLPNKIKNIVDSVVNFFSELPYKIGYAIGFVIGKLVTWAQNIKTWVTTEVPKIINNIITFFKQLPGKIWNAIVSAVTKLGQWGAQMLTIAKAKASEIITSVVSFFKQLPGKIWSAIIGAVERVSTWGSNLANTAKSKISQMVSSVVSTAKSLPGKIKSAIQGAITAVTNWCNNMKTKASNGIKNVVTAITNGFKNLPNKVKSIGKNVVEGIWNGIKNATSWIKKKVGEFAKGILDGMKKSLGIKSPSRVFRDQVGKFIAEGIGAGITENEDSPLEALDKVGEDMIKTAKNINGITLNRQIESTFSGTVSQSAGLLNKLDYIINCLEAGKQIVLDTGVLVGETVNAYDSALMDRKAQKLRGW